MKSCVDEYHIPTNPDVGILEFLNTLSLVKNLSYLET